MPIVMKIIEFYLKMSKKRSMIRSWRLQMVHNFRTNKKKKKKKKMTNFKKNNKHFIFNKMMKTKNTSKRIQLCMIMMGKIIRN